MYKKLCILILLIHYIGQIEFEMLIFGIRKIQNYITNLDIYLAKNHINSGNQSVFGKQGDIFKITKKLPECGDDETGVSFLKQLIKIYTFEANQSNDYYENNPEDISQLISMSYFTLMIYLINKMSANTDTELSEVLGGVFCIFLQIFMNFHFLS